MPTETTLAMLSFKLGPVQPFIESARTLRDLWTGSYLLSWLTAHAMKPIIEDPECGYKAFITPHVSDDNPLLKAVMHGATGDEAATLPCLPHTFAAEVPLEKAEGLRIRCLEACENEWKEMLAKGVKQAIQGAFATRKDPDWDRNWDAQIDC